MSFINALKDVPWAEMAIFMNPLGKTITTVVALLMKDIRKMVIKIITWLWNLLYVPCNTYIQELKMKKSEKKIFKGQLEEAQCALRDIKSKPLYLKFFTVIAWEILEHVENSFMIEAPLELGQLVRTVRVFEERGLLTTGRGTFVKLTKNGALKKAIQDDSMIMSLVNEYEQLIVRKPDGTIISRKAV